ncbi:ShlB/FhaC/HecB family hemolysin secretion/activation protein [Sphingobium sp. AP50]|uniref:ShlB/FhaC/HecB family hemolysin secretion/activation protein n=1 Tax=Sphingobium sp. AP50 TaxID=1884369 RepID=UPI0015A5A6D7|nr:ShlB/FhaC/HecB family hemolysin secretion/activation protein [Sphingobium sp. AP50]
MHILRLFLIILSVFMGAPILSAQVAPDQAGNVQEAGLFPSPDVAIRKIVIKGSRISADLDRAVKPFEGKAASEAALREIADVLARTYNLSDIAIFNISLDSFTPADGVLQIHVQEGHVEKIQVDGDVTAKRAQRHVRAIAAPLALSSPLRKSALQRVLRQIADMQGNRVEADMIGGQAPGGLVLRFTVQRAKPRWSIGFDNGGTQIFGRPQARVGAGYDNVLTGGDRIDMLYSRLLSSKGEAMGATYMAPLGVDGLQLSLTAAHGRTELADYELKARTTTLSTTLSYPLHSGVATALSASAALEMQQSHLDIIGLRLITENVRIGRLGLNWSKANAQARSEIGVSVSRSIDLPGAQTSWFITDRRFTKLRVSAAYHRLIDRNVIVRLLATGQYSKDALPSAEAFFLGGDSYGRGFEPAIVSGDSGIAGNMELAWAPPASKSGRRAEFYAYVDGGRVTYNARPISYRATYGLASTGAGVRVRDGLLRMDLSANRVIKDPYVGFGDRWRLSVSASLSWP